MGNFENELFHEIQQYLKSSSSTPEVEKNELFSQKTKEFAQRESQLVNLLLRDDLEEDHNADYVIYSEIINGGPHRKRTLGLFSDRIPSELEISNIALHHFDAKPSRGQLPILFAPSVFEIDTLNVLSVGKHMDSLTESQVAKALQRDQILPSSLYTLYVFDEQGNYGKISTLPGSILDQRSKVSDDEITLKHVISPFTEKDIEVVDKSLSVLEDNFLFKS